MPKSYSEDELTTLLAEVVENPKLLSKILHGSRPNFEELRSYRQVSRLWHELTLDLWRGCATLLLLPDIPSPVETPLPCSSTSFSRSSSIPSNPPSPLRKGVPMSEFLSCIVDPSDPYDLDTKPFSRIHLKGINIESEMEYCDPSSEIINVFPRIWDLIGAFVTYLHCDECVFENTVKLGAFQKLVMEKTPFLQELCMTNTVLKEPSWEQNPHLIMRYDYNLNFRHLSITGNFPMGLGNFLPYIPKIERLTMRHSLSDPMQERHYFSTVWVPLSNLRRNHKDMYALRSLDVLHTDVFKINFSPQNQFRATSLPLEELSVEVAPSLDLSIYQQQPGTSKQASVPTTPTRLKNPEDVVLPMLKEHQETLRVFRIFRPPFTETYVGFPWQIKMEKMRDLELWGNITESLSFLKFTPNLRRLRMNTTCYEMWSQMKDLLELEFPYEYMPFREDVVKYTGCFQNKFQIKMPWMRELHLDMQLGAESIAQVAEWMPNLRVYRGIFDRDGFRSVCATMRETLVELEVLWGSDVNNETVTGVAPGIPRDTANITAMTRLRRVKIHAYCGKGVLKDSAVYLGFLKMTWMHRVEICVSRQMSESAEESLKAIIPYVRFIRNYGPGPHADYECCNRKRFVQEVMQRLPAIQNTVGGEERGEAGGVVV